LNQEQISVTIRHLEHAMVDVETAIEDARDNGDWLTHREFAGVLGNINAATSTLFVRLALMRHA
jgi:hypothetical protein